MSGPHLGLVIIGQNGQSGTRTRQYPHSAPASQRSHGGAMGGEGDAGGAGGSGGAEGAGGQQNLKHSEPSSRAYPPFCHADPPVGEVGQACRVVQPQSHE
mmetsp:Transcript_22362/g.65601  ORF Transcript_22362/g.65601 Transcript_22362/m.65601 type:complete len:100 (-) Transcript_22362:323-622(-)